MWHITEGGPCECFTTHIPKVHPKAANRLPWIAQVAGRVFNPVWSGRGDGEGGVSVGVVLEFCTFV